MRLLAACRAVTSQTIGAVLVGTDEAEFSRSAFRGRVRASGGGAASGDAQPFCPLLIELWSSS